VVVDQARQDGVGARSMTRAPSGGLSVAPTSRMRSPAIRMGLRSGPGLTARRISRRLMWMGLCRRPSMEQWANISAR